MLLTILATALVVLGAVGILAAVIVGMAMCLVGFDSLFFHPRKARR